MWCIAFYFSNYAPAFRTNPFTSALGVKKFPQTLQTLRRHTLEETNPRSHRHENLKSCKVVYDSQSEPNNNKNTKILH